LAWPGYQVYQHEIDEKAKTLKLWIRRKRGNRKIECSGCGRKSGDLYDTSERAVRDLPWSAFTATVFIEIYRVKCPDCGVKREKVPLLPSKAFQRGLRTPWDWRVKWLRPDRWHASSGCPPAR